MASQFFGYVDTQVGKTVPDYSPGKSGKVKFCPAIKILWMNVPAESEFTMDNTKRQPLDHLMAIYPGNLAHLSEMSLLDKNVNSFKERVRTVPPPSLLQYTTTVSLTLLLISSLDIVFAAFQQRRYYCKGQARRAFARGPERRCKRQAYHDCP